MTYQEKLLKGIEAAEKAGDEQGARRLAAELGRITKAKPDYQPSTPENMAAGAVEGLVGLPDAAIAGGTWVGKKAGLVDETTDAPLIGPKVSAALGLYPDRSSPAYLGGNVVGGALTGGAMTGGLKAGMADIAANPSLVGKIGTAIGAGGWGLAKEAAATGGAYVGSNVGKSAGEAIGGETAGDIGGVAGAIFGGNVPAATAKAAVDNGARWMFNKPPAMDNHTGVQAPVGKGGSEQIYDAAVERGLPPSVGLVGNRAAQYLENALGLVPGPGSRVRQVQDDQLTKLGKLHYGSAWDIGAASQATAVPPRPPTVVGTFQPPDPSLPPTDKVFHPDPEAWGPYPKGSGYNDSPQGIGSQIMTIARRGSAQARDTFGRREDALEYSIGNQTGVDTSGVRDVIRGISDSRADPKLNSVLSQDVSGLNTLNQQWRSTTFPFEAGTASGAESRMADLNTQIEQINTWLFENQAKGGSRVEHRSMEQQLAVLENERNQQQTVADAANMAINMNPMTTSSSMAPYGPFRTWRSNIGMGTEGNVPIEAGTKSQIYAAATDGLRQTAANAGQGAEFDDLMRAQDFAHNREGTLDQGGYLGTAEKLSNMETADAAYSWLTNGKIPVEKMDVLAQLASGGHVPPGKVTDRAGIRSSLTQQGYEAPAMRQMLGDFWWDRGRSTPGQQDVTRDKFSPQTYIKNFNNIDPQIIDRMDIIDPSGALRAKIDDALTLSSAMAQRGAAANPSGTTALAIPFAMLQGGQTALNTILSGAGFAKYMLNPENAKVIAKGRDPGKFKRDVLSLPSLTSVANALTYDERRKIDGSQW